MPARFASFRWVPFLLFMALAAGMRLEPQQPSSPVVVPNSVAGTYSLAGPWKFRPGDDPSWASPRLDDSQWELMGGDRPWGVQGHARYSGWAWYRLSIAFPETNRDSAVALLIEQVSDVYEVYWNGKRIGSNGRMPPFPIWYPSQQPQVFQLGAGTGGNLAIRVWRAPPLSDDSGDLGGLGSAPLVGSPKDIRAAAAAINFEWLRQRQFLFGEHLIFGLIAVLSLLVWWRNRKQWLLLWMMGYALSPVLTALLLGAHIRLPYVVAMGLAQPIHSIQDISLWFLLLWLLRLNEDRALFHLVKILAAIKLTITVIDGFLVGLVLFPRWLVWAQTADAAITTVSTLLQMLPLVLVGFAVSRWKQLDAGCRIVAVCAFSDEMLVVIRGALEQGQRFTGWTVGEKLGSPLFTINGNAISLQIISRAALLVAVVYAVYASYREEQRHQLLMASEFSHARELQRMLIPETQHEAAGFALTCSYRPALEVGGDFFQLIPLDGDGGEAALLLLGDVSGHGLKAALSVSYVIGVMRVLAEVFPDPGPLLTEMNRRICGRMQNGFVTCIAARIDRSGCCALASAGHPPPFLNCRELEIPGELPLGIDASVRYHQASIHLHRGDHLALFTDGLLEARSKSGELCGFERLEKLFAGSPSASEATQAAVEFGQDDDITVVTLTYQPNTEGAFKEPDLQSTSTHVV